MLYGHIGESFYLRQLSRQTGISLGPVQREIRQLVDAGLVTKQTLGTQTLYSANQASPVFQEMRSLVAKTVGVHYDFPEGRPGVQPRHKSTHKK